MEIEYPLPNHPEEEIKQYLCTYDRTIFQNPSNQYCVAVMKTSDQSIPLEARKKQSGLDHMVRFVAVGYELPRTDKVSVMLKGVWKDGKYGPQFHVMEFEEIVPQTREGIQGYLSSRLVKGIGEKTAELIVGHFGADALKILEQEPQRLLEIRGITPGKLEDIKASYTASRALRDLMLLLAPFQITPTTAAQIYEHFGARSVDILRENPYELCQISGFGFLRVDAIVRKGSMALNSPIRIRGALYTALHTQKQEKGHLYLAADTLLKAAAHLLNNRLPPSDCVRLDEISNALEQMLLQGEVVGSSGNIYPLPSFYQEDETARHIAEILLAEPERINIDAALEYVRCKIGISLSQRQSEAIYMAFRHNLSIVTGPPGTGKTTILRAIIEVFRQAYPDRKILLAAPTGRASGRMTESTGIEAKTIHSMLGLLGEDAAITPAKEKERNFLDAGLLLIDESSMVDMWLASKLFQRIAPGTKVVLVGDVDQLQSVGAGDVFRSMIECGAIPVTVLDEIFRQKAGSVIAQNAKLINEDSTALQLQSNPEQDEFVLVKAKTQDEAAETICRLYRRLAKETGLGQIQILSPYRSEGTASSRELNRSIRELVNPSQEELPDLKVGGNYFRGGDKVMQTQNNQHASNGDIGFIQKIFRAEDKKLQVAITFSGDRNVEYGMEEMEHMELAYATTIHKGMGSEFDVVILPVIRSHLRMLNRNLIYTAVTRARKKVILVGQRWILFHAIHKSASCRNTQLGERICNYVKAFTRQEALKQAG